MREFWIGKMWKIMVIFSVIAGKEKQESHGIFYGGFAFFS